MGFDHRARLAKVQGPAPAWQHLSDFTLFSGVCAISVAAATLSA
jgi:hypothetical protein